LNVARAGKCVLHFWPQDELLQLESGRLLSEREDLALLLNLCSFQISPSKNLSLNLHIALYFLFCKKKFLKNKKSAGGQTVDCLFGYSRKQKSGTAFVPLLLLSTHKTYLEWAAIVKHSLNLECWSSTQRNESSS